MMIPDSIQAATERRARKPRNIEFRRRALQLALEAPVVRLRPEAEERVDWLMRELKVNRATARRVDQGVDPALAGVPATRVCEARAFRNTDDLHQVMFIARASRAAASVGRFVPAGTQGAGTFFMISRDLLMTNHHVVPTEEKAKELNAEFNYELDENAVERVVTHFALAPDRFFHSDARLDFAVIALGDHLDGPATREDLGVSPLVTEDLHAIGTFVNIIQHPNAERKQIVFRENRVLCQPTQFLTYNADALTGSSGSPVYNDDWKVVALHHSAADLGTIQVLPCLRVQDSVNEGIAITRIVDALGEKLDEDPSLSEEQRALLRTALRR